MHTAAEQQSLTGIAPTLPRIERALLTLHALGVAALTLVGIHRH
jgi:hypothetical protein